ncbi:MAG: hypothetical protein C5B50_16495 [Verrucomicrobia bacterium]|nr:MAG: hypothetical protein C5B50_16495 [Verrucomicrobiota bacterium]
MSKAYKRVPTKFGPEITFDVRPGTVASFRAAQEARLELLKKHLLREQLRATADAAANRSVRVAAAEAAALAWVTPYPLLVFPLLFEEKAQAARFRVQRQKQLFERSWKWLQT